MSKAFTKEEDDSAESEKEPTEVALPGGKNYITPEGFERLRAEVKQILHVDRPALVQTVSWAASNGDRSENGDYIYGKKRLRELDRRVRFLNKRLDAAVVVDPKTQKSDRVLFGATVTVRDEADRERKVTLVGIDETDVKNGRVSWISPIGTALLNGTVGDVVTLRTPKGNEELEILKIQWGV